MDAKVLTPSVDFDEVGDVLEGFDVATGLSIRYIDPTGSDRSLGSYICRQLSVLPDGARFYVLPVG